MRKIGSVQGLRAIAALSVAMLHILHDAIPLDPAGFAARWHDALPWQAGVDLFFVISGFVMVHASADLFGRRSGSLVFMTRRVARIVPLYWATTTLFLLVALIEPTTLSHDDLSIANVVKSYLFVPARTSSGFIQPIYSLGWTLNYEMFFYVVFATFISQRRPRALLFVGLFLGGLIAAHRLVPSDITVLVFWTDPIMAEFLFGMVVGAIATAELSLPAWLRAGVSVLAFAALLIGHTEGFPVPEPINVGLPMASLVAMAVLGRPVRMPGAMLLVGEASYALYLVHPFAMRAISLLWRALHLTGPTAAACYVAVSLVLALLAALATHLWFERPVSAWLRARLAHRWLARVPAGRAAI